MIAFQTEQTVERRAHEVWSYAADIARHPEWMGVLEAHLVSGQPTEIGTRGVERMKLGPRTFDVGIQVFTSVPDRQIGWRMSGGGPFAGEITLDLEPLGPDRTRAVWSGSIGLTGWWRLLEPLMAAEVKSGEAAELRRLKETLEAAPTITPAFPAPTS